MSADASWRQPAARLDHWSFVADRLQQGSRVTTLLSFPGARQSIFRIDWLHTMDLGVAADIAGNVLAMVLRKVPGETKDLWHAAAAATAYDHPT